MGMLLAGGLIAMMFLIVGIFIGAAITVERKERVDE
jgi:hypothetical protein